MVQDPNIRVHPRAPDWSISGPEEWASREYERALRRMTARPCIDCGRVTTHGNRCPEHDRGGRSIADMHRRNARAKTAIWKHPLWRRTREAVLRRDGYTCVDCGRHRQELGPFERLLADHLHYEDPFNADTIETRCSTCSGRKDGVRAHA